MVNYKPDWMPGDSALKLINLKKNSYNLILSLKNNELRLGMNV